MSALVQLRMDVLAQANSPSGMQRLVHLLLSEPLPHPLERYLYDAIRRYVFAKRTFKLWAKHSWPLPPGHCGTASVKEARLDVAYFERRLRDEIGGPAVRKLTRQIGASLVGLLSRTR